MVLLYEPDPDLSELWRVLLEHLGCTVQVVADLAAARRMAGAAPIDLVVARPGVGDTAYRHCQALHTATGAAVIALLPGAPSEATAGVHVVPLPAEPAALRALDQRLLAGHRNCQRFAPQSALRVPLRGRPYPGAVLALEPGDGPQAGVEAVSKRTLLPSAGVCDCAA